jgi:hypothetical protein
MRYCSPGAKESAQEIGPQNCEPDVFGKSLQISEFHKFGCRCVVYENIQTAECIRRRLNQLPAINVHRRVRLNNFNSNALSATLGARFFRFRPAAVIVDDYITSPFFLAVSYFYNFREAFYLNGQMKDWIFKTYFLFVGSSYLLVGTTDRPVRNKNL